MMFPGFDTFLNLEMLFSGLDFREITVFNCQNRWQALTIILNLLLFVLFLQFIKINPKLL